MDISAAITDVRQGIYMRHFWMTFGANEIKSKYRRSKLGQFWITLSVGIFIFFIGGLYRQLFNISGSNYFAYLAVGYILWQYISDAVVQGCNAISRSRPFLMQRYYPVSVFVMQLIYKEVLTTAHHVILLPLVFLFIHHTPSLTGFLLCLLGFAIVVYTSFWVALLVAILTLRNRDIPPIAQSLMRVMFFVTPVIWVDRKLDGIGLIIATFNPFKYYISIVRDPLIGNPVHSIDWIICLAISAVVTVISLLTLAWAKRSVTYWL